MSKKKIYKPIHFRIVGVCLLFKALAEIAIGNTLASHRSPLSIGQSENPEAFYFVILIQVVFAIVLFYLSFRLFDSADANVHDRDAA